MTDNKKKKVDKRAYTFMFIPHRGEKTYTLSLPIRKLKRAAIVCTCCLVAFGAFQIRQMLIVSKAEMEQTELMRLRTETVVQEEKLRDLAKLTQEIQGEMARVTQLESEVKRSLETDGTTVSRSGVSRDMRAYNVADMEDVSLSNIDDIISNAKQLKTSTVSKQTVLVNLNEKLVERNAIRAATPSIWPASGEVTSRFGGRNSPGGVGSSNHKGLDIAGVYGSPIHATADGTVEQATWFGGYGLYILIDHGHGYKTAYAHNSAFAVKPGDRVKKGQVIAYMGNSGVSTGTHCHYEVHKNGVQVDPANFL